jgi:hypothetical protein
MIMMRTLAVVSALLLTGCAAPVPKEASMDWPAFIASVPGSSTFDEKYMTSTVKNSAYHFGTPSLDRTQRSFVIWCEAQKGQVPKGAVFQNSFYQTAVDWNHQDNAFFNRLYHSTPSVCVDDQGQLMAAMLVHQYKGVLGMPLPESRLPGPVIAFYTREQAAQFVDFYKNQRAVLSEQRRVIDQEQRDLQNEKTRQLHANPKIGDTTNQGMIIELRPPLALIQYNAEHRFMFGGKVSGWERITGLVAPR